MKTGQAQQATTQLALVRLLLGVDPKARANRWRALIWIAGALAFFATLMAVWAQGAGLALVAATAEMAFQIAIFRLLNVPIPWFAVVPNDADSTRHSWFWHDGILVAGIVSVFTLFAICVILALPLPNNVALPFAMIFLFQTIAAPIVIAVCLRWCITPVGFCSRSTTPPSPLK